MRPSQPTAIRIGYNRVLHVHATDNGAYIAGSLQLAFESYDSRRGSLHEFRLGNALRRATDNHLRAPWSEPGANISALGRHMRSTVVQRTIRSGINDGNAAIHSSVALITTNSPFATYPPSSSPGVYFSSPQFPQNLSSHPDRRLSRSTANCRIRKARYLTWGNIALTHEDQPSSDEPELRYGLRYRLPPRTPDASI
ncbi:uncharacterized protein BDZ83DRAFT_657877 [Colletotrichum acutatum]|uniref:Uncharacterized protein n=1 Tax=Glomerella acutata TaxID=27357 RepID=A0AAD8U5N1_GLOAC|nr:uncharacterized protein BDZ83DRAFT_657877 [Colletotrichum acutatum]KAK1706616.1 hypothetical protein BDZ83DRAFT_657877 [Colletotrichum acutatum]